MPSGVYPRKLIPLSVRFWKHVEKTDGCWLWNGATGEHGYGSIGGEGGAGNLRANRVSWQLHYGKVPDGLHVCHRCDNPPCVRPDHLFLGTRKDNLQDAKAKGRTSNQNRLKPRCDRGHAFTTANTYVWTKGDRVLRVCRTCSREKRRAERGTKPGKFRLSRIAKNESQRKQLEKSQ